MPTDEDIEELPIYSITSGVPWHEDERMCSFDITAVQGGVMDDALPSTLTNYEPNWHEDDLFSPKETQPIVQAVHVNDDAEHDMQTLQRWQQYLNLPSLDLTKKTLKATTQLAIIEYNPTHQKAASPCLYQDVPLILHGIRYSITEQTLQNMVPSPPIYIRGIPLLLHQSQYITDQ